MLAISNTETPQLIWNNGIRAELMDFVQTRQERALKGEPQPEDLVDGFAYSDLKPEVRSQPLTPSHPRAQLSLTWGVY